MDFTVFGRKISFNRGEVAGSFGDIGTDLPLIVGLIATSGLDSASALAMFGLMQILTGMVYGLPMPVQPLKAMVIIMISQRLDANLLYGGGLAIGITMLFLTLTGMLEKIAKAIPKSVVRGIQFGLGLSLATLALKNYIQSDALPGYVLAAISFALILFLQGSKKYPPALVVILIGVLYALFFKIDLTRLASGFGFSLPKPHVPSIEDISKGFLMLALPQLGLSISNAVIATKQTLEDLFPERSISVKRIGFTYSLMNIILPFLKGIPNCHGAGGIAGHYAFGARTGGSVITYGLIYLILGLFFAGASDEVIKVFPLPVLGIILLFEGLALMSFIKDVAGNKKELFLALLVSLIALGLPGGFALGIVVGTGVAYLMNKGVILRTD
ncbi:MAG: molybdate transporter family protein [Candidatus Caldarchaeum sp.]